MVYFSSYKMGRDIHRSHTIFGTIDEKMNTFNKFLAFAIFASAFAAVFEEKNASVRKLYGNFGDKSTLVASVPLSEAEKQDILEQHNNLRSNVANGLERRGDPGPQPPASNMRKMRWDNDLAMAAQKYSDLCILGSVNQITFLAGPWQGRYARYAGAVGRFYDGWREHLFLTSYNNSVSWYSYKMGSWPPVQAALYYNMISAVTYAVGCAVSECSDFPNLVLVCLYAPREKYVIYKVGKAASECPSGTYANNSLCV